MTLALFSTSVLATASFITSVVSGVLGMAGGVALIGVMTTLLPPVAVVPLHGAVQLVSNGTRTVLLFRHVSWRELAWFLGPLAIGAGIGVWLGRAFFDYRWLQPLIGGTLLAFIAWRRLMPRLLRPPLWAYPVVGLVVGAVSLFIGSTGPISALVFRRDDWSKERTVATMAVAQASGHLLKLPAFLALGFDYGPHLPLLALLAALAALGSWVGRRALGALSTARFALLFDLALGLLAAGLLVGS